MNIHFKDEIKFFINIHNVLYVVDFKVEKHNFLLLVLQKLYLYKIYKHFILIKVFKILGIFVAENLKWNRYINHFKQTESTKSFQVLKSFKSTDIEIFKSFSHTFVLSLNINNTNIGI